MEKYLGDLDQAYAQDALDTIIEKLKYDHDCIPSKGGNSKISKSEEFN